MELFSAVVTKARKIPAPVVVGLIAIGGMFLSNQAAATVVCPSNPAAGSTTKGSVEVAAGMTCILDHVKVNGSVTVDKGGTLVSYSSTITGGLEANSPASVELNGGVITKGATITGATVFSYACGTRFNASLTVQQNKEVLILGEEIPTAQTDHSAQLPTPQCDPITVMGSTTVQNNTKTVRMSGGDLVHSVTVTGNTGTDPNGSVQLESNVIGGSLDCWTNTLVTNNDDTVGGTHAPKPNNVTGSKSGQCAGL